MTSVHTKIDDVTSRRNEQNLNPNQIWISRQAPFTTLESGATINDVIREEDEAESGIFCMSNVSVFNKSDDTSSLSCWIGQVLSQKMIAGNQTGFYSLCSLLHPTLFSIIKSSLHMTSPAGGLISQLGLLTCSSHNVGTLPILEALCWMMSSGCMM